MIIAVLAVLGLVFGSFVNALVWRVHEQEEHSKNKKKDKKYLERLSISKGRSMCPHCKHELKTNDLIPVISWLSLGGKCRYCKKPISPQYPLVELLTAVLFVASYIWWPEDVEGVQVVVFAVWLPVLVGLIALAVYDLKWMLLPTRLIRPLTGLASIQALILISIADKPLIALVDVLLAVAIGGGVFYLLFQLSGGKWIGGGDVRLGWLLGLIVATPTRSVLVIFLAALLGSGVSVPLLATGKMKRPSVIPFGPFLIAATIIVVLFGGDILDWYQQTFLQFTI